MNNECVSNGFLFLFQNADDAKPLLVTRDTATIEFRNISFNYVEGKTIFDNLSLSIPAGKKIAIVGGSGSG